MLHKNIKRLLTEQIDEGSLPGAAVHISLEGKELMHEAFGYRSLVPTEEILSKETIFDLASLTKVVATTPAVLKLIDEGELLLSDPVHIYIEGFAQYGKEEIRIRHLLTHTSGLVAHRPFFNNSLSSDDIIEQICSEKLVYPAGTKVNYSDLNYILLFKIIEKITIQSFPEFVKDMLLDPLEMTDTGFNMNRDKSHFAATEVSRFTKEMKFNIVHDDNAESMGGISGHAGLFSTLQDLSKFTVMIENEGMYKGKKILSSKVLRAARKNYTSFDPAAYRGLGWQLKGPGYSPCGDLFSDFSYGHTGFTGTSIWFEPESRLHVILLTNRVHGKHKGAILSLRPKIHNLIQSSLF